MKDKVVKTNITKFDKKARILGILGGFIIVSALALGIPVLSQISSENDILTKEITKNNNEIENLQLQIENGMVLNIN